MKRRIFILAMALSLSLCPTWALAEEDGEFSKGGAKLETRNLGTLNFYENSEQNNEQHMESYDWTWNADNKKGTLTLKDGFTADKVILPGEEAKVTIVAEADCTIKTLEYKVDYGSAQITLTIKGSGRLTIEERIDFAGGDYSKIIVDEGANVVANGGIYVNASGSSTNGYIEVKGKLTAKGDTSDAINTGNVLIGATGVLSVSGKSGVCVGKCDNSYENAFEIERGGEFIADCSEYNIMVESAFDNYFDSNSVDYYKIINIDDSYKPLGYELKSEKDGKRILTFAKPDSEVTYDLVEGKWQGAASGKFMLHQNHDWSDTWEKDETAHWHKCEFNGCTQISGKTDHKWGDWDKDDNWHSRTCKVCEKIETHSWDTDWQSDDDGHWKKCAEPGCTETSDKVSHDWGEWAESLNGHSSTCSVCNKTIEEDHKWGKWQVTADGHNRQCTLCDKEQTHNWATAWHSDKDSHWKDCADGCGEKLVHYWKDSWERDDTDHWKECTVPGCTQKSDKVSHTWSEWRSDNDRHWKECTDGCGATKDSGAHEYDDDNDVICNKCGYDRSKPVEPVIGSSGSSSLEAVYTIAVKEAAYGEVKSSHPRAAAKEKITLTVNPDMGYELDSLTVTDSRDNEIELTAEDNGSFTFIMPDRAVTVTSSFAASVIGSDGYEEQEETKACDGGEQCPSSGYTDLEGIGSWYHEAVDSVLKNSLMGGYGNGLFGPNDTLTRAQFAQILYNMAGKPAVNSSSAFADVDTTAWCAPAIAWASEQGIAGGYGNGLFGPNDTLTREQMAVMLWRYSGSPAAAGSSLSFTDEEMAGSYAFEALSWAVENGIISGSHDGSLDPRGVATRAQAAQMLMNFI